MTDNNPLRRSQLGIPGNEPSLMDDGMDSGADEIFLDLEDSLAPGEKVAARAELQEIVRDHEWEETVLSYRINGLDTRWWYQDIIEVVGAVGADVDNVIIPKIRTPAEIRTVATLLDSVEANADLPAGSIGLSAQIETAKGMNNVINIVDASDRLTAVIFGPADYAASVGAAHGATDYPGHYWHYPLSRVAHAAASAGLLAIGGPYADPDDMQGFRHACSLERDLGYDGKLVIHPEQVATANAVFSPDPEEAQRARRIVKQYEGTNSDSVASIDGKVIDRKMYRMAKRILDKAKKAGVIS